MMITFKTFSAEAEHREEEKMKKIVDEIEEIVNEVCDKLCRYPDQVEHVGKTLKFSKEKCQEILDKKCEECPLQRLL